MHSQIEDYLKGKSLLITGASGYLASNLANSLKKIPCKIRRLTRKNKLNSLEGNAAFENIQGEISDRTLWDRAIEGVDIIFHFAGQTSVYVAEEDPIIDYEANVLPMLNILEACKKNGARLDILFAGTSTQMGLPENLGQRQSLIMEAMDIALKSGYNNDYQKMIRRYFNALNELETIIKPSMNRSEEVENK